MNTSGSSISTCEIVTVSDGWNSATCTWNKLLPRGLL